MRALYAIDHRRRQKTGAFAAAQRQVGPRPSTEVDVVEFREELAAENRTPRSWIRFQADPAPQP